jgi:hypothetical protein
VVAATTCDREKTTLTVKDDVRPASRPEALKVAAVGGEEMIR